MNDLPDKASDKIEEAICLRATTEGSFAIAFAILLLRTSLVEMATSLEMISNSLDDLGQTVSQEKT
jgi:hypothetical protein